MADQKVLARDPTTGEVVEVVVLHPDLSSEAVGAAASAVANHVYSRDPHSQYLTQGEGDARYAQLSQIPAAGTDNAGMTRTTPTTSASTAVTVLQSFPLPVGSVQAGAEFEFSASLRVINKVTATDSVVTLSVGAVDVLVLTQGNGIYAAGAPGAAVFIEGRITFTSTTTAEAVIVACKSQGAAFNAVANTSAPVDVVTAEATSLDLKFNTSGTTATFICRQATIQRVK